MRRGAPVGEAVIEGAGEGQCRSHDSLPISGYGFIGDGAHLRRRGGDAKEDKRKREEERKRQKGKKAKRQKGKKAHEKTRETGGRNDKTRRARIRRRHLP